MGESDLGLIKLKSVENPGRIKIIILYCGIKGLLRVFGGVAFSKGNEGFFV